MLIDSLFKIPKIRIKLPYTYGFQNIELREPYKINNGSQRDLTPS